MEDSGGGGIRLSKDHYFYTSNYLPIWAGSPYTISFWIYLTSAVENRAFGIFGSGNFERVYNDGSGPCICPKYEIKSTLPFWVDCSTSNSNYYNKTNTSYMTSSWRHIAVTRDNSGIIRCFIDGILQTSLNRSGHNYSSNKVVINNSYYYENEVRRGYGYIDDICLISGKALWTENFDPPMDYLENYIKMYSRLFNKDDNMYGIIKTEEGV